MERERERHGGEQVVYIMTLNWFHHKEYWEMDAYTQMTELLSGEVGIYLELINLLTTDLLCCFKKGAWLGCSTQILSIPLRPLLGALFHQFHSLFEKATCVKDSEKEKVETKTGVTSLSFFQRLCYYVFYSWQLAKNGGSLWRVTY